MPVTLSVTRVRQEIQRLAGEVPSPDDASPSTRLLGRIFHEAFARLLGKGGGAGRAPSPAEAPEDPSRREADLAQELYDRHIGPAIQREQVHLRHTTRALLDFWQAGRHMCAWIASLREDARTSGTGIQPVFSPEQETALSLMAPGWTDSVILTGIADLVLQLPAGSEPRPRWCVIEFKLGRSCPEADLAQVCLYHLMLSEQTGAGAVAYIRFTPEKTERFFTADAIRSAQERLKSLIGRLAGVLPGEAAGKAAAVRGEAAGPPPDAGETARAAELVSIVREYGKEIALDGDPAAGPAFTRFFIRLGKGVKLTAVQNMAKEIQHRMQLGSPPYIHISEGRVVVDIQRPQRRIIRFEDIRHQLPEPDPILGCSRIILGVDLTNTLRTADLAEPENAHILIGGTTGSGKSEWIRTAIAGLILTNTPETLRLVLIDPKRNAFNDLKASPFLLHPAALVYPDEQPADAVLEELADEMDRRYKKLAAAGADTLDGLERRSRASLPRIVCICDEYFDLINRDNDSRKKIEAQIFRLGAKARSAGIHLVIATQHPDRQTVKGTLDVNLPARVGLKVNKGIDAAILLNRKGAENLLGSGDLLFRNIGEPVRLQSPLLGAAERRAIFCRKP